MLDILKRGDKLTGISDQIRDDNQYLFCRHSSVWQYSGAEYSFENPEPITFPGTDINKNGKLDLEELKENGYAKAYILAAGRDENGRDDYYIKSDKNYGQPNKQDERQWAWYCINEQKNDYNDLYHIAIAYQNYKQTEKPLNLIESPENSNPKTITIGEKIVYGPINIEYSYGSATTELKSDEWGGFSYAFFDENGNNISNRIKLCTLVNDEYTEIESTPIILNDVENAYNYVMTADYNRENLFIVTEDKTISNVKIKLQANNVDYIAKMYSLEGTVDIKNSGVNYCSSCRHGAVSYGEAIGNENAYVYYKGKFYKWTRSDKIGNGLQANFNKNYYIFDGVKVEADDAKVDDKETTVYKGYGGSYYTSISTAMSTYISFYGMDMSYPYFCQKCGTGTRWDTLEKASKHVEVAHYIESKTIKLYEAYNYIFVPYYKEDCKNMIIGGKKAIECGTPYSAGENIESQGLDLIDTTSVNKTIGAEIDIDIKLAASIEVTKKWNDGSNEEGSRPEKINLVVYRSTDQANWTKLTENTDYKIEWSIPEEGDEWKAIIGNLLRMDDAGNEYYFKVEEEQFSDNYVVSYSSGEYTDGRIAQDDIRKITITNGKLSDLGGYVWLDEQTGVKPAKPYNGIMDSKEKKIANIPVYLYYKDPTTNTFSKIKETVTDENGHYKFEKLPVGDYYIEFEYDGINYEDTLNIEKEVQETGKIYSQAFEDSKGRNKFNARFETIEYGKSNDGTTLNYDYADRKSTLITTENGKVKSEFIMTAVTDEKTHASSVDNLNLGLVKRGADFALSTDLHDAIVSINGQETTYKYNKVDNSISIGTAQTSEQASYNLSLYKSDYNYRIENYIKHNEFKENSFINKEDASVLGELQSLKVNIVYKLNLQNQSGAGRDVDTGEDIITAINEVKYDYDEKYTLNTVMTSNLNTITYTDNGDILTITPNATLKPGETKTIYLVFDVKDDKITSTDTFSNKAEIIKYSTSKGLIDVDSQPGNFINVDQVEDDNDTAGGLGITLGEKERTMTGKVFDKDGNNVNDVIVQLIELKTVDGKVYEYIWQETVSGTEKGLRLSKDGKSLEEYSYTKADGYYEFKGFIPGDYIVRFIYGDGTTYDMTNNVIKYNGQDYKSVVDKNYKSEWYNSSSYTAGQSVARDNEARRLETMSYSVDIDAKKGLLLKLLDNTTLNLTEEKTLIGIFNELNDNYENAPGDIVYEDIKKEDKDNIINTVKKILLTIDVLPNTWMCAETSKIKVTVDNSSETITNNGTPEGIPVKASYDNINFGLELRPETKIELKKYITGFKLVASNGQTLVNAYIDVNEYLNGTTDISNKVQGVKDNVTILNNVWQYEVVPTDINTIVDGASLEFEYTLVVKNTGNEDYLSEEVASKYVNSNIADYKAFLTTKAEDLKITMKNGTYRTQLGNTLGTNYYAGGTGTEKQEVLTQVTSIRDYVNNNLDFISGTKPDGTAIDLNSCSDIKHRILRDDYSMQDISVIYISTGETGKMNNDGNVELYTITVGKNPISSTGNLEFDTYIAEVMSYTNAAGRRSMTSTPGNAEIIDTEKREGRVHEIDEADTGRIQVGVATGEDNKTNYILITSIVAGIAIIAAGAFIVKKYVVK